MNNKFFSKHQLELQKKHGGLRVASALYQNRVHEDLEPHEIDFISTSHFFFIATNGTSGLDISIKCGLPNFVTVSKNRLYWEELDGNRMYKTVGNINESGVASLLFVNFFISDPQRAGPNSVNVLRLNGKAKQIEKSIERAEPAIEFSVEKIIPNCPRYLPKFGSIQTSPFLRKELTPEWKTRDYVKDLLTD